MKNAPEKVGMTIDGKRMDLEHFMLDVIERHLPKPPSHYLVAEILNTDLSIKRVTVYFNPTDTWKGNSSFFEITPQAVGTTIGAGLQFLNSDPNTLAYKCWIVEIETNLVVHNCATYSFTKCQL